MQKLVLKKSWPFRGECVDVYTIRTFQVLLSLL